MKMTTEKKTQKLSAILIYGLWFLFLLIKKNYIPERGYKMTIRPYFLNNIITIIILKLKLYRT